MAFLSKVGGILKQSVTKQIELHSKPSIFQSLRWMSSSKVFIGGLSYSTDEAGIQEAFSQYGTVVDARVIVDRESGRSKGFGFVTYTSSEEASSAIQALDGKDLHGRIVKVAYAMDRARSYGGDGGYGGGGSGGGGYGGSGGGGYGAGGYGGASYGGNYGGGSASGGGYGLGGSGSSNQGGADGGYGSGGANYGGGNYGTGGSPGGYNAGGYGGSSNFGASGGSVTGGTSFASSGFEEGSGLGYNGGSDQFGTSATGNRENSS